MKTTITTLALGLAISLAGTASAANFGPATYGGHASSTIDFSNALRSMYEADSTCRATKCGPTGREKLEQNNAKPSPVETTESAPCYSTFCGAR